MLRISYLPHKPDKTVAIVDLHIDEDIVTKRLQLRNPLSMVVGCPGVGDEEVRIQLPSSSCFSDLH